LLSGAGDNLGLQKKKRKEERKGKKRGAEKWTMATTLVLLQVPLVNYEYVWY